MSALTVLDLFSAAAGGWSLGMHRAGFQTIAACESVDWRRALYAQNNPGVRIYEDVRTLTADQLVRDLGRLPDIIVGSPPCQDISEINYRGRGIEGDQSRLYLEAPRIIDECRPRWFALENSPRLRTRGYDRIADELDRIGYAFWPLVVGAGHAGAAHLRKRSWIVGMDPDAARKQGRAAGQPRLGADVLEIVGRPGACGQDGAKADYGFDGDNVLNLARIFRGPSGSEPLGRHLRAYDGLPTRVAEQCRQAYGDAVLPQIPEAIGRAILRTEAALAAVYGAAA